MSKKAIIGAIFTGAVAGAATLLFAPKKGSELREDAKNKLAEVKGKAQNAIEKYRNTDNSSQENAVIIQEVISENTETTEEEAVADTPNK